MVLQIEILAKQAQDTFSKSTTSAIFPASFRKFIKCANKIQASDVGFNRNVLKAKGRNKLKTPAFYTEIMETSTFNISLFILRSGAKIPLHDHPGMYGVMKIIDGNVEIASYSVVHDEQRIKTIPRDISSKIKSSERDDLIPVTAHEPIIIGVQDEPCVLRPRDGNFHEITAIGGDAAFVDIIAPPYTMAEKDCSFYIALESENDDVPVKTWLLRKSSPPDFWTDKAPYTGPEIIL